MEVEECTVAESMAVRIDGIFPQYIVTVKCVLAVVQRFLEWRGFRE